MSVSDTLPGMKHGSTIRNLVVGTVYAFLLLGVLGAAMGGGDETSDSDDPKANAGADNLEEQDSENDSSSDGESGDSSGESDDSSDSGEDTSGSDNRESNDESSSGYSIRVQYSGEWSGSISADGSSRSIDGSGEETLDVNVEDVMTVSANAQKGDDSGEELTIQILEDGEVVKEQSTTAEYGVAQVSHSGSIFDEISNLGHLSQ